MFEYYKISDQINIFYKGKDREDMLLVFDGILPEIHKINDILDQQLKTPVRVYFTDSMLSLMLDTTTFGKKIIMLLFLPIWYRKAKKYWNYSKGWLMQGSIINSIVLKTPEGYKNTMTFEKAVFNKEFEDQDVIQQLRRVFLHQYVQALLSYVKEPEWFEEGISYLTLEKYFGKPLLKEETLEMVQDMPESSIEDIIFSGIKGYWMVKYLEEEYPDMINELLTEAAAGKIDSFEENLFSKLDGVEDKKSLFQKSVEQLNRKL